ncbi:hypothetical protein LZ32DRAFT_228898 [Colletotrichum eremochloae]|nr:hypothetical protein LZ32DRAFT_228898 [Colletotrichum eremochloae]
MGHVPPEPPRFASVLSAWFRPSWRGNNASYLFFVPYGRLEVGPGDNGARHLSCRCASPRVSTQGWQRPILVVQERLPHLVTFGCGKRGNMLLETVGVCQNGMLPALDTPATKIETLKAPVAHSKRRPSAPLPRRSRALSLPRWSRRLVVQVKPTTYDAISPLLDIPPAGCLVAWETRKPGERGIINQFCSSADMTRCLE